MSQRQPQSKRGDKKQYRRPVRPGGATTAQPLKLYQRVVSSTTDGGGVYSSSASSTTATNLSFKKPNEQGGQSSAKPEITASTKSESAAAQNDAPSESSVSGVSNVPTSELPVIPTGSFSPENYPTPPKSQSSEFASEALESAAFTTTVRDDTKREVSLQFGSFSPGLVNGMKIPARTSSAPPNLDEQKKKQANFTSFKPETIVHTSSNSSRPQPKDYVKQSKNETPPQIQSKKDIHAHLPAASVVTSTMSSSRPSSGMPRTIPLQQSHIPVQFGIPGPQIQAQGMTSTSLQMPMPLPVGSPPQVQQAAFVPGFHPHPLQPQGLMHQGQGFNFFPHIGLGPQFGSSGIGVAPGFAQPHIRNSSPRRVVKITHPKTHEELKLDERAGNKLDGVSCGPGSHHNVGFQMQPIAYELSHPMNYFPRVHPAPVILQCPTSVPPASSQALSNLRFNSSGMPGMVVSSNTELATTAVSVIPVTSSSVKSDASPNEKNILASSPSINSAVNERSRVNRMSPTTIAHSREESKIECKQSIELSKHVRQPASSDKLSQTSAESFATLSSSSADGKSSKGTTGLDAVNNQMKITGKKDLQAESPGFSTSSTKASTVVDGCAGNAPAALKEVGYSTPGTAHSEMDECEATNTSSESCGELPGTTKAPLPTADVPQRSLEGRDGHQLGEPSHETLRKSSVRVGIDCTIAFEVEKGESHSSNTEGKENSDSLSGKLKNDLSEQLCSIKCNEGENMDGLNLQKGREHMGKYLSIAETSFCKELATPKMEMNMREGESSTDNLKTDKPHASIMESSAAKSMKVVVSVGGSGPTNYGEVIPSATGVKISSKSGSKHKPTLYRVKSATSRGQKKRKEILQKADAAGSTSDLYMAFKGSKEKPESSVSSESVGSTSSISAKQILSSSNEGGIAAKEDRSKLEPDDWEKATEISTPKLEIPKKTKVVQHELRHADEDISEPGKKRYSKDFLLMLSGKFTDLPSCFKIAYDLAEALMDSKASIRIDVDCGLYNYSGQIGERPSGVLSPDYRGSRLVDDSRRNKSPVLFASGLEPLVEISHRGSTFGFRPGHGGNYGGVRNPRSQTPGQYFGEPNMTLQGGIQHNGPVADRWQQATGFQNLFNPVQSRLLIMHKAEKKYVVRKVTDAEEAKQRQLKAILNKLTPQNFERLFEQIKEVNIENAATLFGVISQIFDKALMEPTFCEMYANFCYHLAGELPDFVEDNQKITFKRLLLNKCQEEFERHEREQAEADKEEGDGEVKQSEEEREEKRIRSRRRMLGNIRLIGELYKKKMLTERIMHECIHKLLGQYQNPDEEDIEALCKLMSTIGEMIDHPKAKQHMDAYFDIMTNLSDNMKLSSRVRFMLKDVIDLRENKWQQRRKVEGPKKIEELHRDAAQERQASRMSRGHSFTSSVRRGQPVDFGHRPSNMFSQPSAQMGAFHGMPPQTRGFGTQDVRLEDRHLFKNKSLPPSHRPTTDTTITLGPQGGLARGMSVRGLPMLSGPALMDVQAGFGEFRSTPAGIDGYNSMSEWSPYNSKQEATPKYAQENYIRPAVYGQSHRQGPKHYANSDLNNSGHSGRSEATSPPTHTQSAVISNISSGKALSEERLSEMSMAAIREFYSAKDENEVFLCVKDMDAPSFYPSMISLWVTDSFERKDRDRDLLSWLLVNLTKSSEGILNLDHLAEGFQSVLATLEDAVTDAPKAATYLGYIFGRIIIENVISLREIARILQKGGEEPGHLLKNGLAHEVLQNAFEMIRSEKGEATLEEICRSSNVRLDDFHPPGSRK